MSSHNRYKKFTARTVAIETCCQLKRA